MYTTVPEGNPIIRDKFTADPTALVLDNTIYLFTGHDEAPAGTHEYLMKDWLCFSSSDLKTWREHPSPLRATDYSWAAGDAYASSITMNNGKFYFYTAVSPASGQGKAIGVVTSDTPAGPFHDPINAPLITHDMLPVVANDKANLDPSVLVDDDGCVYLFWGNGTCYFAELSPTMTQVLSNISVVDVPGFAEGAHIHKKNGWYYLSYGYKSPERVAYAMSRNIRGPWNFKGILNELAGNCETNRPCIIDFEGDSYFIYHNGALPDGGSHRRSVCIDRLYYNEDGSMQKVIMTSEGII